MIKLNNLDSGLKVLQDDELVSIVGGDSINPFLGSPNYTVGTPGSGSGSLEAIVPLRTYDNVPNPTTIGGLAIINTPPNSNVGIGADSSGGLIGKFKTGQDSTLNINVNPSQKSLNLGVGFRF